MRRILVSLSTLVAAVVAMATSAPAAFAMRVTPTGDASGTPARLAGHSGLATWEIVLIAAAAGLLIAAARLVARYRRQTVLRPAAG